MEGDAPSKAYLILCVAGIREQKNEATGEISTELEMTDGWYSIAGKLDHWLQLYTHKKKIFVGQKLRICGAQLQWYPVDEGCISATPQAVEGADPLETTLGSVWEYFQWGVLPQGRGMKPKKVYHPVLNLHVNGVRRAR